MCIWGLPANVRSSSRVAKRLDRARTNARAKNQRGRSDPHADVETTRATSMHHSGSRNVGSAASPRSSRLGITFICYAPWSPGPDSSWQQSPTLDLGLGERGWAYFKGPGGVTIRGGQWHSDQVPHVRVRVVDANGEFAGHASFPREAAPSWPLGLWDHGDVLGRYRYT